jgi:hypothetical protein
VVGFSGDFEDADVVVSGLEPGEDFDVLDRNAIVLGPGCGGGVVGLLGLGCLWVVVDWSVEENEVWKGGLESMVGYLVWVGD